MGFFSCIEYCWTKQHKFGTGFRRCESLCCHSIVCHCFPFSIWVLQRLLPADDFKSSVLNWIFYLLVCNSLLLERLWRKKKTCLKCETNFLLIFFFRNATQTVVRSALFLTELIVVMDPAVIHRVLWVLLPHYQLFFSTVHGSHVQPAKVQSVCLGRRKRSSLCTCILSAELCF